MKCIVRATTDSTNVWGYITVDVIGPDGLDLENEDWVLAVGQEAREEVER